MHRSTLGHERPTHLVCFPVEQRRLLSRTCSITQASETFPGLKILSLTSLRVLWKLIRSPVCQLLGFPLIYRGWICRRWCTRCLWLNRVLFSVLLFLTQKKLIHYTREGTGEVVFMFLTKRAQYSWLLSLPTYSSVEMRVRPCGRQSKGPGPFSTTYLKTNVSFIMFFVIYLFCQISFK